MCKEVPTPTDSSSKYPTDAPLKLLFQTTTLLCVMMVVWILWFPGSMLIGRSKLHAAFLKKYLDPALEEHIVSRETVYKMQGHTAVHLTHLLPGAIWSACIPFQLHRGFRKDHKVLHRWMGYVFFGCSFLMSLGILIILHRDLYFEKFFTDLPPMKVNTEPTMYINTAVFLGTAVHALRLARSKRFFDHQAWVIRHIASGLWIAWQRVLLIAVFSPLLTPPIARSTKRLSFISAGFMGMAISYAIGEYAVHLLKRERDAKSQRKKVV